MALAWWSAQWRARLGERADNRGAEERAANGDLVDADGIDETAEGQREQSERGVGRARDGGVESGRATG